MWQKEGTLPDPWNVEGDGGAFINSKEAGASAVQDDDLTSPLYELGGCTSAELSFKQNFQATDSAEEFGQVFLIPGGSGSEVELAKYDSGSNTASGEMDDKKITISTDDLDDKTSFKIKFHYEGSNGLGWYVDSVGVTGKE
jgi:hypothetical protein